MAIELGDLAREGMFRFTVENVREALPRGIMLLLRHGEVQDSRNGPVIAYPEGPVATIYRSPAQRVLLSPVRNANPFFHLVEAMWMLAGREDAAPLDFYIKDFGTRFGYKGVITDGYGYRWRHHWGFDQLDEVIKLIKADPTTRRAVLTMWDPEDLTTTLAKPCNLQVMFRIRYGCLDMTVSNRSNDILWGAYGANAVHLSFLQEYVASKVGVGVGQYTQFTNDFHMYVDVWERLYKGAKLSSKCTVDQVYLALATGLEDYGPVTPLMGDAGRFDQDLKRLWNALDKVHTIGPGNDIPFSSVNNPFLEDVYYMASAYYFYKHKNQPSAHHLMTFVNAPDWKQAGIEWLHRHAKKDLTAHSNTIKTAV